jgi:hypothetical protein
MTAKLLLVAVCSLCGTERGRDWDILADHLAAVHGMYFDPPNHLTRRWTKASHRRSGQM